MNLTPEESLEEAFRRVEEESERRAQAAEAISQQLQSSIASNRRTRRRGSISISRFGQLYSEPTEPASGESTPSGISSLASQSAFYRNQIKNGSRLSMASQESELSGDDAHAEDAHHVTQVHQIAGRQTISRAVSGFLPRRISRARSGSVMSTGENMTIGISVEEATVESAAHGHGADAVKAVVHAGPPRHQISKQSLTGLGSDGWIAKAKDLSKKLRRKSKLELGLTQS